MKRTTEITFLFYRRRAVKKSQVYRCPVCGGDSDLITIPEAAQLASVSRQALQALVATEEVHSAAWGNGELLICRNSLLQTMHESD